MSRPLKTIAGVAFRVHAPTILALVVGVVASVIAYAAVREYISTEADAEFAAQASNHANTIVNGFSQAIYAIQSVGALYDSTEDVSWDQFVSFVTPLLERFSTIAALGWAPQVHDSEREAFETAARELFPGFRITERRAGNGMVVAVKRAIYFPVYFIRPYAGNEAALGFDLYSNRIRKAAINRARDSGRTISTARIRLVQERAHQYSVLLIHPLFERDPFLDGDEKRNRSFLGVASAVFRVGEGVEEALRHLKPAGINIWLFDRSSPQDQQFLYFHPSRKLEKTGQIIETEPQANAKKYVHRFALGGRTFELILSPTPSHFNSGDDFKAWLALVTGLAFTILLAAYLELTALRSRELVSGKQKLEHQIKERKMAERQLREANRTLEILSRIDPLMGIANRRHFDEYIGLEWQRAARHNTPLSLIIGDVDHFKLYNDTYGHMAGDRCLKELAHTLSRTVDRPGDLVARYGGEEIAIVLPATTGSGALSLAEKVRLAVVAMAMPHEQSPVAKVVTMSIGVGTAHPAPRSSIDDFLQAVDDALYRAKQQGRNQTVSNDVPG